MNYKAFRTQLLVLAGFLLFSTYAFAYDPDAVAANMSSTTSQSTQTSAAASGDEKFNPGEMIMHHIADAHDWHIYGHIHMPLPVILKTDKGFEFFSSGNFRNHDTHAEQPYKGTHYTYALHHGKIVVWDEVMHKENEEATHHLLDLSITKNVITLFILVGLMLGIFQAKHR